MENEEKKKNNVVLIVIIIIIILLLLLFAIWYFLIRDKGGNTSGEGGSGTINTTTPAPNKVVEYDYKDGVLTAILDEEGNPLQTDFVINGLILVGNRHSYAGLEAGVEGVVQKLVEQGYKKEGLNSSFYLNEYIEFYIDTAYTGSNDDVKIMVVPHKTVEEYLKLSLSQLEELASNNGGFVMDYQTPDTENYKYVGNGYVNMDYPEGKYDILFTYKGKLAYFINITEIKEPTE